MLKNANLSPHRRERVTVNPLVSIVVVNFNGQDRLLACLESLDHQTYEPIEVVLVDNNSRDESVDRVREDYPDVRILTLSANVGFAGGCNAGIAVARGEFVATLNNDAVADPHWLAELMNATADRPDVGMVASKMLFADDRGTINSIGIALDRTGIAWDRGGGRLDSMTLDRLEVFGPCAGAALYRRLMFDDIGRFDEDFFMYLEDVDLAWRAQLAGWRGILAPKARVFHEHSASAGPTSSFKRYHLARNKVWLIAKNYPSPEIWLYLPIILLYDVAAVSLSAFSRDSGASLSDRAARMIGRIAGLLAIAGAIAKRREIQRRRRVPGWRVGLQMSRLPAPWAISNRYAHLAKRSRSGTSGLTVG